ncbi:MAG: mucoidy inhibitor MuiA family protein [Hasllibacter sp.]
MRALALALLLPLPAIAADVTLRTQPAAVTLYGTGAEVVRLGETATLPAGTHRLFLPLPQTAGLIGEPRLALEGATLTGLERRDALPVEPLPDTALQTEIETLEEAAAIARDRLAAIEGQIEGLEARVAFARSLAGGDLEWAEGTAQQAAALIDLIGREIATARADLAELQAARREAQRAVAEARAALARARLVLQAAPPPPDTPGGMIATIALDAPAPVTARIDYLTAQAGWTPDYLLDLDTVAGTLTAERRAQIRQATGEAWDGVALTLSTADPRRALSPTTPGPDIPRVFDAEAPLRAEGMAQADLAGTAPRTFEAAAAPAARAVANGLSLRYDYAPPVRLAPTGAPVQIVLGTLDLPVRTQARAVPRFDRTAFLIAEATNDSGETLVPGPAAFTRDGDFVGRAALPLWAPGAEEELPFGALDTIRLDFAVLENGTGDAGIVTTSLTREVRARFTIENTGTEAQDVRALYALPVSEQEELEIDVTAAPRPDERNARDVRGLAAWDLVVAPGEEVTVDLAFDLAWPEGQTLFWQP